MDTPGQREKMKGTSQFLNKAWAMCPVVPGYQSIALSYCKVLTGHWLYPIKDGHNTGRNGMDLTEAEYIKRWQEDTKDLHNPDNHDGVIPYLEPDILECEEDF